MNDELDARVPPRSSPGWKTPMFEQYWRIKDSAPDILLFYRMGDFYELFGRDALVAAPLLGVQLTARDKSSETPIPMCGVPFHAWENYAEKLLSRGLKIGLCEQLSEPTKGMKLVERGIVRILTPGLPIDYQKLESRAAHWLVSIGVTDLRRKHFELYVYDFLAGVLFSGRVEGLDALQDLLQRLAPKEILLPALPGTSQGLWKEGPLSEGGSFWAKCTPWAGNDARRSLEEYLLFTQRCTPEKVQELLPATKNLQEISGSGEGDYAAVPTRVLEQWDVFPHLVNLFDACGSAMGSRKLRTMMASPLKNAQRIALRQAAFSALQDAADILSTAREVYDFERLLGRFRLNVANWKELFRVQSSLRAMGQIFSHPQFFEKEFSQFFSSEGLNELAKHVNCGRELMEDLETAFLFELDLTTVKEAVEVIRPGFDAEFDALKELSNGAQQWLIDYENQLRVQTEIATLKVRYNRVFGFYIEVTKTHLKKVPETFERKQTTVQGERFTTEVLRNKESEILQAGARASRKAEEILEALKQRVRDADQQLRVLADYFAWVDVWCAIKVSTQKLSRFGPWTLPLLSPGPFHFKLEECRHPILESRVKNFVPNNLHMGTSTLRLMLLTGPNMAGKSTLMRQAGLCLLLGQVGLPVPARSMEASPCSGFFSRMGASDKILDGESTFMVEMKEMAEILKDADQNAFLLIDEIGRGTSSSDGLALAQALLEHLVGIHKPVVIFATHYHELAAVAENFSGVRNASLGIEEEGGHLFFQRELRDKPAESSYGLFVAKMAGLPNAVLARAEELLQEQAGFVQKDRGQLSIFQNTAEGDLRFQSLKQAHDKLREALSEVDLDALSPREAWSKLESLKALS